MNYAFQANESIKRKVVIRVAGMVLALLSAALGYIIFLELSHLNKQATFNLQEQAQDLRNNIDQRIEYLRENTLRLAQNKLLINAFIDDKERSKYLLPLIENFKSDKNINHFSLVDFDGRVLFQTDANTPTFEDSQELRLSLNLLQTVLYFDKMHNEVVMIIPIKYYATTQGAIVVAYDIAPIIAQYDTPQAMSYTKVFYKGSEIYGRNFNPNQKYFVLPYVDTHPALVSFELEMGIPNDHYLQPLYTQATWLGLLTLLILGMVYYFAYFLGTSITRPITMLYNRVNKSALDGVESHYVSLGTHDELEVLGYAYYTKEKALDELNKTLQLKIQEATAQLESEKNRFMLAIEGTQDGMWDWNLKTNALFFSERFETMLGYDAGELPQNITAWFGLLHPEDKIRTEAVVQEYLASKGTQHYEAIFRLRAKDGTWKWILGRGKAQFDPEGNPERFVGFNTDFTQQKEYQEKLDHTAKHDALTHLPNRFLLSELLEHEMHVVKRNHTHLALLFIDLDGFKEINDTYGHGAGDVVLSTVATRMQQLIRESDIIARLGGDEFVIVFSDLSNNSEVVPLLQRLLNDIATSILHDGKLLHVSASIGVSFYPQEENIGNEALLRQADQAMYYAKLAGKNQYQFFNLDASMELKENQHYISELRHAIAHNEFLLYYQPKVHMKSNRVIGLEALLRWQHPTRGILTPESFLPYIEHDAAFMIALGRWVFETAFVQLEAWQEAGLTISLNINVSAHEVQQHDFVEGLQALFARHATIKPASIEIELLETSALENFELTLSILQQCQALGISIAIDDFGTGYASLHYLKNLPMNTIKIDKSFVIDLLYASNSLSIIEASVGLAHAFDATIVAEGVESQEHGKMLLQLGCEIAQGYAIAKPMPAQQIAPWIASWQGYASWSHVKLITQEGRTALYASIEHRNWINQIERYLRKESAQLPQMTHANCHLGRWIAHAATPKQRKHPAFERLTSDHEALHAFANTLLLQEELNPDETVAQLHALREKILTAIEEIVFTS